MKSNRFFAVNVTDCRPDELLAPPVVESGREQPFSPEASVKSFAQLSEEHGGLFTYSEAARLVGVSSARIAQLVSAGTLGYVKCTFLLPRGGVSVQHKLGGHALVEWFKTRNPKGGPRPKWKPPGELKVS